MSTDAPGAFVISLDFELHWGMRDVYPSGSDFTAELIESRLVVGELARLFAERGIRATWATVGMLFASSRSELEAFIPSVRPRYELSELDPYTEEIGTDEESDPLHLAGSLVDLIASTPGQEVGSHTFSHYYCLEAGQNEQSLRADLASAKAIAEKKGVSLTSLVLPRNQWNPNYLQAVADSGFTCFRGPQPTWAHHSQKAATTGKLRRAARLIDTYTGAGAPPTASWKEVAPRLGVCNVPASAFFRPYTPRLSSLEVLQENRLKSGLRAAARRSRIFHLWWHPQNFANNKRENFGRLERLLDEFAKLSSSDGLRSLTMRDVATETTASD